MAPVHPRLNPARPAVTEPNIRTHSPSVAPAGLLRAGLLALSLLCGLGVVQAQTPASAPQVPVVAVGAQAVGATVVLDGRLEAVRQAVLSVQASGRMASLAVKAGDRVRVGQVLAVVDDRVTQAGVAQAQAGVAQAEAQLTNAQANLQRTRDLRAQGFVAQAALDTAQAQWQAAQAAVAAARAGQTQAGLAQGFTRLTAPFDGWVLATHAEAGALVMPGTPVLTVYAPQPLRAVVHVPASQQTLARQAQRIEVELPGQARWVLLRRGELTAVYVARPEGTGFVLRAVRAGVRHGDAGVEVVAGLKAGERVALDPVRAGLAGAVPAAASAAQ